MKRIDTYGNTDPNTLDIGSLEGPLSALVSPEASGLQKEVIFPQEEDEDSLTNR